MTALTLADFTIARINSPGPDVVLPPAVAQAMRDIVALWRQAEEHRNIDPEPEYAYGHKDGTADGLREAVKVIAAIWCRRPDYDPGWR